MEWRVTIGCFTWIFIVWIAAILLVSRFYINYRNNIISETQETSCLILDSTVQRTTFHRASSRRWTVYRPYFSVSFERDNQTITNSAAIATDLNALFQKTYDWYSENKEKANELRMKFPKGKTTPCLIPRNNNTVHYDPYDTQSTIDEGLIIVETKKGEFRYKAAWKESIVFVLSEVLMGMLMLLVLFMILPALVAALVFSPMIVWAWFRRNRAPLLPLINQNNMGSS